MRRALDLTQQEFASRIGTSQNAMANYETGHRNPSSSVVNNICKEFRVNEAWLRTGSGEMLQELSHDEEISAFIVDVLRDESAEFKRRLISALSKLDSAGWAALEQLVEAMSGERTPAPAPPAADQHAIWETEARAEAEEYYRRILLEKKQAGASSQSSGAGSETA